jgi:hypothetical protein
VPYFYDSRIEDVSASDMTRRQAILEGLAFRRDVLSFMLDSYEEAHPLLTADSPFVDVIEELSRAGVAEIDMMERAVKFDPEYEELATVAEKWDALHVSRFYTLLDLGQFIRLLEHERTEAGDAFPLGLAEILDQSLQVFEERAAEVEENLDYTVVPIKKLASIQLVTALYAMDHVQRNPELAAN